MGDKLLELVRICENSEVYRELLLKYPDEISSTEIATDDENLIKLKKQISSVANILSLRNKDFNLENLQEFLAYLVNFKDFIDNFYSEYSHNYSYFELELRKLLQKVQLYVLPVFKGILEKKLITAVLKNFIIENETLIDDINGHYQLLLQYNGLMDESEIFNDFIIKNQNNIDYNRFKATVEVVLRMATCYEIHFGSYEIMKEFISKALNYYYRDNQNLLLDLITIVDNLSNTRVYSKSRYTALQIEQILPNYFNPIQLSYEKMKASFNSILSDEKVWFDYCELQIISKEIDIIPKLDILGSCFLSNFLKSFNKKVYEYYTRFDEKTFFRNFQRLSYKFDILEQFPVFKQFAILSVFNSYKTIQIEELEFFYVKLQDNILFEKIQNNWINRFVEQALKPPYCDVLQKFKKSPKELPEILMEVKENVYLTEFPPGLMGLNLPNSNILIRKLQSNTNEGSTFVIFLHELAHLLQRVTCACFNTFSVNISVDLALITGNKINKAVIKNGLIRDGKIFENTLENCNTGSGDISGAILCTGKTINQSLNTQKYQSEGEKIIISGTIIEGDFKHHGLNCTIADGVIKSGRIISGKLKSANLLILNEETGIIEEKKISGNIKDGYIREGVIKLGIIEEYTINWLDIEQSGQIYKVNESNITNIEITNAEIVEAVVDEPILINGAYIQDSFLNQERVEHIIFNGEFTGGIILSNGIEGGEYLHLLLFGTKVLDLTEAAQEYLFSDCLPTDLNQFQKEFNNFNKGAKSFSVSNNQCKTSEDWSYCGFHAFINNLKGNK